MAIKLYSNEHLPLEMHKVKVVQKLRLLPIEERKKSIELSGCNTFLLNNKDVFLDMLTDSGVNAMSDNQIASMMVADDAYAGSETFYRLQAVCNRIFNKKFLLPAHQGRACENIIAKTLCSPGQYVPTNYHFTTTKAHIQLNGAKILEFINQEGTKVQSETLFKGNFDVQELETLIQRKTAASIAFVRIEAGANLIGGQPVSVQNMREVAKVCRENKIKLILDASLLQDNLYFIKQREAEFKHKTIEEITATIADLFDLIYFSARKLGFARGGAILTNDKALFDQMRDFVTLYEGFLTYGGMSVREMEAIAVGLEETMDEDIISQGPIFIEYMCHELQKNGIPVVTPAGGLGVHIDAMSFLEHVPRAEYRAGSLAVAVYIASGARGMERGTISEERDEQGNDTLSNMELVRMALPRRVFTLSQIKYTIDRITWLFKYRHLIGGLKFIEEPQTLRFFIGRLAPTSPWTEQLVQQFRKDFGDSL